MSQVTVGVSLKTYFGHERARAWFDDVAARVRAHGAVMNGAVELFITPTYLQVLPAIAAFAGTPVRIGGQDVSGEEPGAFTGEVTAAELAEVGATIAEIGHAERRRLFSETEEQTAAKTRAALRAGLTPLLCIGETEQQAPADAAVVAVDQLRSALDGADAGAVIVAYEPVWAIGAPEPAGPEHIRVVAAALRFAIQADAARADSAVIYGGAAGPGLLTALGDAVDGVFLGRFAHDPDALVTVLDEAAELAALRQDQGRTAGQSA
ncbi:MULTISPECIES: triose-phosphate isomerase family protein [unclassified Microbacterium]|uniref:triose-phosphate isomerase family protein n=1 Tax=unclassified Microbacterium TaxID=2609290 RepID=UPI000EAACD6F|nr:MULTISPECIES: triose-phosphate isomerase family protein [unclassified Microbacterium]MBT2486481.1 triosephosphate isomerase [Microbacterium sp. ISL-108]RKN69178.1 triosephosphate isomerase [Microbacterium sp. CGR2]